MGLNLKDETTVALVTEVARRLGVSKTAAVRELARERLAQLDETRQAEVERRVAESMDWLRREVWPRVAQRPRLTKAEREGLLGIGDL